MWSVFPWHRNGSQGSSGIYHPSASAECWDERHVVLMPGLCPIIDKDIEMQSGGGTWVTLSGPARPKFKSQQGSFPPQLLRRLLPIVDSVGGAAGRQGTDEHVLDPWWRFQKHRQSLYQQTHIFKDNRAAAAENRESQTESWKDFWKKVVWREIFFEKLVHLEREKKYKCQSVYLSKGHEKNVKCKNVTSSI